MSQRLRHGKALCGKVFSGFVETFNAIVDFKDNLKGDDDVAPGANGHLHLDRTDPNHPVIRCRGCGGTSGQGQPTDHGRFHIASMAVESPENEEDPYVADITFANTYYRIGGRTYTAPTTIEGVELPAIVALKVDLTGATPNAELVAYANLSELQEDEGDTDYNISPIFEFDETGSVSCDFRLGPDSGLFEFGTAEQGGAQ